jgi:hypothetical protein
MNIYLLCPNDACDLKKIPITMKAALKDGKCPSCGTSLQLNGEEAQAILLAKTIIRHGWEVSGKQIEALLDDYYIKILEVKIPRILVEETQEEMMSRKVLEDAPVVLTPKQKLLNKIDNDDPPIQSDTLAKMRDPGMLAKAEQNAKEIDAEIKASQLTRVETVIPQNEENGGFSFSGGLRSADLHDPAEGIVMAGGSNVVARKLIKGPRQVQGLPDVKIPSGPLTYQGDRSVIFQDGGE